MELQGLDLVNGKGDAAKLFPPAELGPSPRPPVIATCNLIFQNYARCNLNKEGFSQVLPKSPAFMGFPARHVHC